VPGPQRQPSTRAALFVIGYTEKPESHTPASYLTPLPACAQAQAPTPQSEAPLQALSRDHTAGTFPPPPLPVYHHNRDRPRQSHFSLKPEAKAHAPASYRRNLPPFSLCMKEPHPHFSLWIPFHHHPRDTCQRPRRPFSPMPRLEPRSLVLRRRHLPQILPESLFPTFPNSHR